jgi:hypothetical protein
VGMAMLPIFMIGVSIGMLISYVFNKYKFNIPSEAKLRLLEHIISDLKTDIALLETTNEDLRSQLAAKKRGRPPKTKVEK